MDELEFFFSKCTESRKVSRCDALNFAKTRTNSTKPKWTSRSSCAYTEERLVIASGDWAQTNSGAVPIALFATYKVGVPWRLIKGATQVLKT